MQAQSWKEPMLQISNDGENLRASLYPGTLECTSQNKFQAIEGHQPMQDEVIDGCIFYDRCSKNERTLL